MRTPFAAALVLGFVALGACGGDGGGPAASPVATTAVEYDTPGGVHAVADLALPEGVADPPAVVLLHQRNGDRRQWEPLLGPLLEAGYAVLAPDLRGFGESTRCAGGERCEFHDPTELSDDVFGAIAFLAQEGRVDTERIAVIGASIGANGAFVASGSVGAVATTIAMSPSPDYFQSPFPPERGPFFQARSVLFMSDKEEADGARALAEYVAEPVEVKVYEGVSAHGVELLEVPEAVQDILDWLEATL